MPIYDRENLPVGEWRDYRKTGTTRMIRLTGPCSVETNEGAFWLPEGWEGFLALDREGWPYPIHWAVHVSSYELA